jgi:hypothetical protein
MSAPRYRRSRFDSSDDNLLDPLVNLTDVMLVFAVGLMVALAASEQRTQVAPQQVDVSSGRELPDIPSVDGEAGSGYEAVGRVYRDRETGRLILMSPE